MDRRTLVRTLGLGLIALAQAPPGGSAHAAADPLTKTFLDTEKRLKARLGVMVVDTHTGRRWAHRADERFPLCSTFKAIAAAAVLKLVDEGKEDLSRRLVLQSEDLVTYSPLTSTRIGKAGMSLTELCDAAVKLSDNTAGNQILKVIGGPHGFTRFVRAIGDPVTRLDRWETELNTAVPGDPRDTTTPAAITATLQSLLLGEVLSAKSRAQLIVWMEGNKVGDAKIRAGVPKDWRVADKTGAGEYGTNNDIAVLWPPGRKPVLLSIYITQTETSFDDRNAAMAEIARSLSATLAG